MALYVMGDLHLSFGSNKPMDVFGSQWKNHAERIRDEFARLYPEDTVVLCGDLSWGIDFEEAVDDFKFVDQLPGKKIILKGNHDYWWNTVTKIKKFFAQNDINSIDVLHNNSFEYDDVSICGTRGWFYELDSENTHNELVYKRELGRLETSLNSAKNEKKIVFLHYPPIYHGYMCREIVDILDKYHVSACYYGHLHGASINKAFEGTYHDIQYALVSADYLKFCPKKIME